MVYVTDEQIAQYKRDGYLIIPSFLSEAESADALEGFYDNFAGPYDDWIAQGANPKPGAHGGFAADPRKAGGATTVFPWGNFRDSPTGGLNLCPVHPDLIDACERIIGTTNIRLCEGHCGIKYAMADGWRQSGKREPDPENARDGYHQDYGNNTIGPGRADVEDDYQHIACFYCLDGVSPGHGPIQMLRHSATKPNEEGWSAQHASAVDSEKFICPPGSLCFYSIFTWHAASDWNTDVAPTGARPVMWVSYSNADRNRLWDGGRYFSIKGGGNGEGWRDAITSFTPRQLNVAFMLPMPGDPLWTDEFTTAFAGRWEGWDRTPYDEARGQLELLEGGDDAGDVGALALSNLALTAENRELKAKLAALTGAEEEEEEEEEEAGASAQLSKL